MSKVMVTLKLDPEDASVDTAREVLGIDDAAIDHDFGVIAVSPDENLYTVLVEAQAADHLATAGDVNGPFSNPPIQPFGPPQTAADA
jgi:hypothetical protein